MSDAGGLRVGAAPRRILLVDADAFFVAVARQVDPEGAGRAPLLIVGGRPGSRGVVCSASYECRAYGVRSAMPIARALQLCPEALCVPVPRQACGERSRAIRAVLARFLPVVQAASIDEWYGDLAGTEALYAHAPLAEVARRIRAAVLEETGLSVSIGGGSSRLVAKMAVERAKPRGAAAGDGVHCVPPGEEGAFLAGFRLSEIPGVGPALAGRLQAMGLVTVAEAQHSAPGTLERRLGARAGGWLARRIWGEDDTPVVAGGPSRQVSRETTFARNLADREALERELLALAVQASADLRQGGREARTVTVKVRDHRFRTRSAQRTLRTPVASERAVMRVARVLFRQLHPLGAPPLRLVGVALSQLDGGSDGGTDGGASAPRQLGLFPEAERVASATDAATEGDTPRDRALSAAVDRIRTRFGRTAIVPAPLLAPRDAAGPRVEE
ncbi:MAG: DNA polymerase IV [Gemmatimonadetes bacterium]|nr:DNA polymerase IV [Gemmatimonadota bacterium]